MTNPNRKSFAVQLAEANNTAEAKGLVLSRWDKSITKGDVNRFKKLCEFGGFWYSLGQILVQLRTASGGSRTDSTLLKNASLHSVAKQRRSEAMKFFENFHVIVENDLLGKKWSVGCANMKDLLKEVDKIVNPKVEEEPKQPTESTDSDVKSDVGLDNNVVEVVDEASLALQLIADCEKHGVAIHKVLDILSPYNVQKAVA